MSLPVEIASYFGVLEYWNIGVLAEAKARIFHFFSAMRLIFFP